MSQNDVILARLASGEPLTPLEALRDFGCFRLAARVAELRARGNDIRTVTHPDGYAVYFMPRQMPAPAENEQRALWGDR